MIPYGKQDITQQDIDAVVDTLKSDFLTQGPMVPSFERSISNYCNAKYGVAVNSATSALHIACLALGLGKGDWLWTSPNTFVASANCALYCGAEVDFVDIDPKTYNMCTEKLEEKLKLSKMSGKIPKIVVPVHFSGQSCNMRRIHELSEIYGFSVIEDASHAIGGKYLEQRIGNCQFSDITVFSFHPVKIITTAEGGLATTNCSELAEKMQLLRSHGITRNLNIMDKGSDGPWFYQQIDLGFNYRMTELQAALGLSQMQRLDSFVAHRHELSERYDELLSDLPIITPFTHRDTYSAKHLYPILLRLDLIDKDRFRVFNELRTAGVGVNVHYIPVHTQPYYQKKGFKNGDYPESENYYKKVLSIPLYNGMSHKQQDQVISCMTRVFGS